MSILKKIGQLILTATGLVREYGPRVTQLIPGTKDDAIAVIVQDKLEAAVGVVVDAEIFGQALGLAGDAKRKAVAPKMYQLMISLSILAGKKPKNEADARRIAEELGGKLAEFINQFED